jgi:hypothetical protein
VPCAPGAKLVESSISASIPRHRRMGKACRSRRLAIRPAFAVVAQAQALSALASHEFYQASSKQVRTFETFIAAEDFFPWVMLQLERGHDGTCDGNAKEIFDFNPRLCLHGSRKTTCDCAEGRRKRTERKAKFYAKSEIGSRSWAKGRTECQSHKAQLFAQSRTRIGGRPQGRTCLASRAEKSRRWRSRVRHPS